MKRKKIFVKPQVKVTELIAETILAGSVTGGNVSTTQVNNQFGL